MVCDHWLIGFDGSVLFEASFRQDMAAAAGTPPAAADGEPPPAAPPAADGEPPAAPTAAVDGVADTAMPTTSRHWPGFVFSWSPAGWPVAVFRCTRAPAASRLRLCQIMSDCN